MKRVTQVFALFVALLAVPALASAQAITSYNLGIFLQGGSAPISTAVLPAASFVCGQARVATPPVNANPNRVVIEDPGNAALDCIYVDGGGGPLLALPFNPTAIYTATMTATNSAGTGPVSNISNSFSRPGSAPSAPKQLRIVS
jgi:hypothetical protein